MCSFENTDGGKELWHAELNFLQFARNITELQDDAQRGISLVQHCMDYGNSAEGLAARAQAGATGSSVIRQYLVNSDHCTHWFIRSLHVWCPHSAYFYVYPIM